MRVSYKAASVRSTLSYGPKRAKRRKKAKSSGAPKSNTIFSMSIEDQIELYKKNPTAFLKRLRQEGAKSRVKNRTKYLQERLPILLKVKKLIDIKLYNNLVKDLLEEFDIVMGEGYDAAPSTTNSSGYSMRADTCTPTNTYVLVPSTNYNNNY